MSTIFAAVSRITDCHECYTITQEPVPSGGLRSLRASVACAWFFGTKEAVVHFISPNAYPRVGHEQKDDCRSKSGVVISRVVVNPDKERHDLPPVAVVQHSNIFGIV